MTDSKMDNRTETQGRNRTYRHCSETVDGIHEVLNSILLFFSFPATFAVIVKLLSKVYRTRSASSAEIFLLQINLANVCLFIFNLLRFLDVVDTYNMSITIYIVFFSPTFTARPIFLLAMCVIFYLAIVHPVTYMRAKSYRQWEWVVITLAWLYAIALNLALIIYQIDIFQLGFTMLFYNTILPSVFVNVLTLRALSSSGPGDGGQSSNRAKRKAFRIILSILVILLLYYVPRVYYFSYPYIAPWDWPRFSCSEGGVIMFLPKISEVVMPVIFLYSLRKLGV